MEVHWLLGNLRPNYHSIADFRKVNASAIKKVFFFFLLFLQDLELIDGNVIAIDGTKVRARNSKKNKYNPKNFPVCPRRTWLKDENGDFIILPP